MVRIGTPKDIENYIKLNFKTSEKMQNHSIFPIWKSSKYMYFEDNKKTRDCLSKIKLERGLKFK